MSTKAIFLDRDGVINKRKDDYVKNLQEFELLQNVEKWLKLLANNDFKLIIITNQSMIGRGLSTVKNLKLIHKKMQKKFSEEGFKIDKIYFCPHNPTKNCLCRKPKIKLFQEAIQDFSIDIKNSWLIGDQDSDIIAGKNIGCKTIKIKTNSSLKNAVLKILNE